MGARQSKRSVDITTTPKKDGIPSEGGVVGDNAAPGDGKLERIEEADVKPTSNGVTPHTDNADKDEATEKNKQQEDAKAEEAEAPVEGGGEVTTPTEGVTPSSPDTATSPESKETKKKDKVKKKWSLRSISFSKKDKSKPAREETPKNGDVTKEEPLAEGGEEVEAASSPTEEKKSTAAPVESSPTTETVQVTATATAADAGTVTMAVEAKEEEKVATVKETPAEEKKEEPTPVVASTHVPVEEKKEEIEKVEPLVAEKIESKEGLVPVSKEVRVEARPAVVVPEDSLDLKEKLEEAKIKSVEVSLKTDESRVNEPISNAVVVVSEQKEPIGSSESTVEASTCHPQTTRIDPNSSESIIQFDSTTKNEIDDDVPPSLPESPIPVLDNTEDLPTPPIMPEKEERSLSAEIPESKVISTPIVSKEEIVNPTDATSQNFMACPLPPGNIPDTLIRVPLTREVVTRNKGEVTKYQLPTEDLSRLPPPEDLPCPPLPEELSCPADSVSECPVNTYSLPLKIPIETETVRSSVRSVTPDDNVSIECSQIQQFDDQNDQDLKVASSLSQNLNLYDDSNVESNERLAKSEEKNREESASVCPLLNATSTAIPENDQRTSESDAPIEKVIAKEIGTTDSMDDAPTSPPPAIPIEVPASPVHLTGLAPVITEDVTSVTKAIEEIDISEKAVAAAVNEAIESANANEIVADLRHQNNMTE